MASGLARGIPALMRTRRSTSLPQGYPRHRLSAASAAFVGAAVFPVRAARAIHWRRPHAGLPVVLAALLSLAACARGDKGSAVAATVDDFGDSVAAGPAARIVSLNPVATELLVTAGYRDRIVGRTHWDGYPAAAAGLPDLGDGMAPNVEVVLGAKPDLVILYASPANQRAADALRSAGVRTLAIRTDRIADLSRLASAFAAVTGDTAVRGVADSATASVTAVRNLTPLDPAPRVVWHMGDPPLFVAGRGSYMGELIGVAGGVNAFDDLGAPSPQVSIEEVVRRDPDLILAGPKGAARIAQNAAWRTVRAVREGRVMVYDTAIVGRPGVRIGEAARHVRGLIAPLAARR